MPFFPPGSYYYGSALCAHSDLPDLQDCSKFAVGGGEILGTLDRGLGRQCPGVVGGL